MHKLRYAISKTTDGNMSFKYGESDTVINNRTKFLSKNKFQINDTVCMSIEMKDNIIIVDNKDKGKGALDPETSIPCDALITKEKNLNLLLLVADCLPIIIFDRKKEVLSLVHSGWTNTDQHICPKVIEKMKKAFNTKISDIKVIVGPGIQKDSLIYDKNIFNKIESDWGEYIKEERVGGYSIDNTGFTFHQLREVGVSEKNINIDYTDVAKDLNYFSHSRDYHNEEVDKGRFCIVASMS